MPSLTNSVISKYILYIVIFCLPIAGFSQGFSVQAKVLDQDSQAVAFANVIVLYQSDQSFVNGATTDESGLFIIDNINSGAYIIRISFIGYETYEQQLNISENLVLNDIVLNTRAEQLSEVELTYTKPTVSKEADRLVFNVAGSALSEGSLMDVLRSTPGVLVVDNSINVRNIQPVVYINNRRVNLNPSEVVDLLEGSSASSIEAVEVITNPSARYDADTGVVLNIKMSKKLVAGYNGSVFANYTMGVFPKQSMGISNTFKGKSVGGFLNYTYNPGKIARVNDEEINYPGETWRTHNVRTTNRENHSISANLEVDLSESDNLSLSGNMTFLPYFDYLSNSRTVISPPPQTQMDFASFNALNISDDIKHNIGLNLDYRHKFKGEATLDLNGTYTNYDYRRNQSVASDYFREDGSFLESTAFRTRSDQDTDILTAQFDFIQPYGEKFEISFGSKYSKIETLSAIRQVDVINGMDVPNDQNSDGFDYDEKVFAGYFDFAYNGEKWQIRSGLRAEQTDVVGVSRSTTEDTRQDYLEWFPNASVTFSLNEKLELYSTYNRSIQRPNYSNLNPFRFFLTDNIVVTGNPSLQPVFTNRYLMGLAFNPSHYFEFYYSRQDGNIEEIPLQDNSTNIITYTPLNLANTREYGFNYFIGDIEPNERWNMYFFTSVYNTTDEAVFNTRAVELDQWANYTEFSTTHTLLKDNSLSINLLLNYISRNIQGLQLVDGRFLTELNVSKTIFKGNGILSLKVADFFNTHDYRVTTQFLDQSSINASDLDNRFVRLGFRYKFGNTKLNVEERDRSVDERGRLDQ